MEAAWNRARCCAPFADNLVFVLPAIASAFFFALIVNAVRDRPALETLALLVAQLCGLIGLVDALFIFSNDRRCIHDHLADSVVIDVSEE